MKRFLLFSGSNYYPSGGWEDFRSDFDTPTDAVRAVANSDRADWWRIVDSVDCSIVDRGERTE